MPRRVLLLFVLLGLSACQSLPVSDESSPHSRIAVGSVIVLHQPLTVPVGHTRVFLQDGELREKHRLRIYYPHCNFELRTLSDAPQIIRPGRFVVSGISWDEELVVEYRQGGLLRVNGGGDGYAPQTNRVLHHRLATPQQPELMRLSCHGGFADAWQVAFPSVSEIRNTLGEYVSIEPPASSQRLILRFAKGIDAGDPGYLRQLERDIDSRMTLLRRLPGGQLVISVQAEATAEALLARLRAHPDILDVQPDRLAIPH
ncbi:MAG: hypothetical protein IBX49_04860 [Gammaproteobacteria bacterium]|nr:hypothetical protein [Gammaproteobacteria bacterium]